MRQSLRLFKVCHISRKVVTRNKTTRAGLNLVLPLFGIRNENPPKKLECPMKIITLLYILNATLLLLHEIESAYEKEWELLNLPGKITGFLLLHIPIILLIFYGLLEIEKNTTIGLLFGIILGIGGIIPFAVHKIFVNKIGHFNLMISKAVIYLNVLSGLSLLFFSIFYLA